jgi:hypothetical protein
MLFQVWSEDGFITNRNMLVNVCMFILIMSVSRCVNCNPQNGWYIRHYELAQNTIKSFTSSVRTSVLGTSTELLSLWRPLLLVLSTHPRHDLSYFYEAMSSSFMCFNRMRLFKRRCSDPSPQLVSLSPICQDVINDIILDDTSVRTRHDPRPPPVPASSRRTSACEESPKTNMKGEEHCQCCSHATGRQRDRAACTK